MLLLRKYSGSHATSAERARNATGRARYVDC